ncbi:VanZ family protein [Photobacterium sanguinicancri]|uniref:VanZ family protein n=1 Tax=Photobacterium sanguinicancri TaxID=875932 RepID=UPI0021C440D8|nr:VanZ family protein [Photobacterium sanguinicancri]
MQLLLNFIRRHWLIIAALNLALITVLSLTPLAELPTVPGTDKTHHFIAYGALIFSVALRRPKHWLWIVVLFFCWSGAIELLQPYVNRYGEWLDLLANGLGLLCGITLAFVADKLFLKE